MASDLSPNEVEAGHLLIEAVSLLVQRQGETEAWIAEQIWQAEERAATVERHYTELEARLAAIEGHLERLAQGLELSNTDPATDARLARLREQVDGLKSGLHEHTASPVAASTVDEPTRSAASPLHEPAPSSTPTLDEPAGSGASTLREPARWATSTLDQPAPLAASTLHEPAPSAAATLGGPEPDADAPRPASPAPGEVGPTGGRWDILGTSSRARLGSALIGAGAIAVLYALLSQLRLG